MTKPIEVTDVTFEEVVLKAELPTIVDFWAVWCGPCKMIAPLVDEIADEYQDKLQVAKLDVDKYVEMASRYGVMNIPTLIIFKGGEAVERILGYMPKTKLLAKITPHLEA
jgi:thioredoxin 1